MGARTKKELANYYDVSYKTISVWLAKIGYAKPKNGGYIYTPDEVSAIINKLGVN